MIKAWSYHYYFCLFIFGINLATTPRISAQQPTNVIPSHQPPLPKVFAPPPAEQTPPGTGKFVIFTREDLRKPGQWDFIAGAWECIPSRPDVPITKRIEFCHSSWNATPFLDCLVRNQGDRDQCPRFVTLQVDAGNFEFSVNLYDINYRTWETRCLRQGNRLRAFGLLHTTVLCQDGGEWLSLDVSTGDIQKKPPVIPIDTEGNYWIVKRPGETTGAWSYDPVKEKYVSHFSDVEKPAIGYVRSMLSSDGMSRAWVIAALPDGWHGGSISGAFILQRNGRAKDISVPIHFQAWAGSGVPVIPIGTKFGFTSDGKAEFAAPAEAQGTNDQVWSIELNSGKTQISSRPHRDPPENNFTTFDGVSAPDYLRPYLKNLTHFGRSGLAPAFLMHLGVLKKQPEYPECMAAVSPDGRHILYKANEGPLKDVFIYGDLQTKQIVRWASPVELEWANMEFVWAETP